MKVLSHRGYWKTVEEKNSIVAFERSFLLGYGTETDIRDCGGALLISHDMPVGTEVSCGEFLDMASRGLTPDGYPLTVALNIKADGLAQALKKHLDLCPGLDAFVFDMSVPDMRGYFDAGIPVFTRMSEVEKSPVWLDQCAGVWLDGFLSEWYELSVIERLLGSGKRVCVVSPELHRRSHELLWERIKPLSGEKGLVLCTDFPEEASRFFFGSK